MAVPTLFVFVVTDAVVGNEILDLISGRDAATFDSLKAQAATVLQQAENIAVKPPQGEK